MNNVNYRHVICAIAKNEDAYLNEWAGYHLGLGFEHIFIYDNDSTVPIEEFFRNSPLRDRITCIRWPTKPMESAQISAYQHFLANHRDHVEWAAVIDIDEFINLKQDASISQFLDRFPGADGIGINWRIFGSGGNRRYSGVPVTERFRRASEIGFEANKLRKTMYRLRSTISIDIHTGVFRADAAVYSPSGEGIDGDVVINIQQKNYDVAQINHYFVKSYDEWVKKVQRGYTDATVRAVEMFDEYDRNEVVDETILRRNQ
ncbi:glycosyltransferase family 2 protein [Sphingomonas sp. R86521]|uniref:glycosyltransferase family 2 protein n=1 Tax=Sphingomonas sp. R86521 TaxID=3093860 RepID=UPI0036D40B17